MNDQAPTTTEQRQQAMTEALRAWDPDAEVTIEAGTGRLLVATTLSSDRVNAILKDVGEHAAPATTGPQELKPSECCGSCSP